MFVGGTAAHPFRCADEETVDSNEPHSVTDRWQLQRQFGEIKRKHLTVTVLPRSSEASVSHHHIVNLNNPASLTTLEI